MSTSVHVMSRIHSRSNFIPLAVTGTGAQHLRPRDAEQQPDWEHHPFRERACQALGASEPLVGYSDVRALLSRLTEVAKGHALLLQAGDCAESFDESADEFTIRKLRTLDHLGDRMSDRAGDPVIRVARIGGQFAKPRSSSVEQCGKIQIPSFRGHLINSEIPTPEARRHDPLRMLRAYEASMAILGSTAAYRQSTGRGHGPDRGCPVRCHGPWASHEALVMDYETNLLRTDFATGDRYLSSTHLPWIGFRTNDPAGRHAKMLAGIRNPVACKIGPGSDRTHVLRLCEMLNPERESGRLVLIARFGRDLVSSLLPPLAAAVRDAGYPVIWLSDPMHGNTIRSASGLKTRHLDDILYEMAAFRRILERAGLYPGGLHLEVAASPVTECLGGSVSSEDEIPLSYTTLCDPRLNAEQARVLIDNWSLSSATVTSGPSKPSPAWVRRLLMAERSELTMGQLKADRQISADGARTTLVRLQERGPRTASRVESRAKIIVTRVGLRFPAAVSFDEWEQAGAKIARVADSSMWCLGDWLVYGQEEYSDRYQRAINAIGLDYQTLRNYAWIARKFDPIRRRPGLSFQHHAEVAALPEEQQDEWLDLAEQNSWSRNQLRIKVRAHRGALASNGVAPGVLSHVTAASEQIAQWHEAAEREGREFEQWVIMTLDYAAAVA